MFLKFDFFSRVQNDVSDIPDLTFSMDADEEKHILYEKNQVFEFICNFLVLFFIFESFWVFT